jgi:isopenicillin N synthase-like dioxygenase
MEKAGSGLDRLFAKSLIMSQLLTGFPDWEQVMNEWGAKMLATVSTVAEVVACGLGLPSDAFQSRMHMGPHLLAPTGLHFPFLCTSI